MSSRDPPFLAKDEQPSIVTGDKATIVKSPVVALLFESSKRKRLCIVRRNGSCSWHGEEEDWRKASPQDGEVLSANLRPYSEKSSIIALGLTDMIILLDSSSSFALRERRIKLDFRPEILSWSPEGRVLFVANKQSGLVLSIDAALGVVDGRMNCVGLRNGVKSFEWSKSGKYFVSGAIAPTFKVYEGEGSRLVDTWMAKSPITFGSWSKDGALFIYGSSLDGICISEVASKAQWVVLSADSLRNIAVMCGCASNYSISQILLDSVALDHIMIIFDPPCYGAPVFRVVRIGKSLLVTFLGFKQNEDNSSANVIRGAISGVERGKVALAYSDGSVVVEPIEHELVMPPIGQT